MKMGSKRKRAYEEFDPNKSDSEDENFDPTEAAPRKGSKKPRSTKGAKPGRKKSSHYGGSDIDEDDEVLSDSQEETSAGDGSRDGSSAAAADDDDDDDDDDAPLNAAGRRTRKVAAKARTYRESSEGEEDEEEDGEEEQEEEVVVVVKEDEEPDQRASKDLDNNDGPDPEADHLSHKKKEQTEPSSRRLVKLKVPKPISAQGTRRTRANHKPEDADGFVQLSTSGRHAVATTGSRSKSPETARNARATRATKSVKKAPEPVKDVIEESSHAQMQDADDFDELSHDVDAAMKQAPAPAPQGDEPMIDLNKDGAPNDEGDGGLQGGVTSDLQATGEDLAAVLDKQDDTIVNDAPAVEDDDNDNDNGDDNGGDDDDDDDDVRTGRRPRQSRLAQENAGEKAEPGHGSDTAQQIRRSRRLTKKSGMKKATEPSSDFEPEPGDDSDAEGSGSDRDKNMEDDGDHVEEGPSSRGRQTRQKAQSAQKARRRDSSLDDEPDIDMEELSEEARQLRQSSRQGRRGARGGSPITYEKRRKRQTVNYYMAPLHAATIEDEAEEQAPTPSRNRRRAGGAAGWDRSLNTTFGPFGGGGGGSILGGPWGTGATGGVDSDSSDDEMMHRSNAAGNVGMTPTTAGPPGGLIPGAVGLGIDGVGATPNLGKIKDRKALADADPLGVDLNVDFSKVGGLQGHIDQLKEMVQLPLLYPELFTRFHVTPPRGVLFHGPPGTGKTLLARALANSVGSSGQKISFYMRKGADALSKWVGEAEKQLRLLFEEARRTQPSIIFFDEIDGLAPVRSSKQEQIHASIVSTLLALMDGMDGRGQVIVIGATNRPDNIDPALRRPGRFDREFYFPLPDLDGRRSILDIHTKDWGLSDSFKMSLAENTKGYGGADLRALCTEAALNAIQRSYPQIYSTKEKLLVDPARISVHASDFMISVKKMIPSSERSATSGARPLPPSIEPLLRDQLSEAKRALEALLPRKKKITALEEAMFEQFDDADHGFGREALHQEFERSRVFRPRFLILGAHGMGQGYLASAILHHFEGIHVQNFDLPSLLADGRSMEQVIVGLFTEVRRHKPSVIYIPNIDAWYATLANTVAFITFQTMLKSIAPTDPVLLLATADTEVKELPDELLRLFFGFSRKNRMEIQRPRRDNRMEYFSKTLKYIKKKPAEFPDLENRKKRILEELPLAPAQEPKPPTKDEVKALKKKDHQLLNALKIQLQPIMDQITRKYRKFRQPVIPQSQIDYLFAESDPDFVRPDIVEADKRPFEIVKDKHGNDVLRDTVTGKCYYNLETTTIEERLSNGFYARPKDFLFDIKALAKDAKNFGDKERTLKANELLSNVEVDVASIENSSTHVDWEALYRRQQQRAKEAVEKERKRKAMQSVLEIVESDISGNASESQGALILGEPVPANRTTARFIVRSPLSNGHGKGSPAGTPRKNGISHDFGDVDAKMGGVDDDDDVVVQPVRSVTDQTPPMGPPPRTESITSGRMLAGMSQISQRSAMTSLPAGVSPSAVVNEASTTKTSDPSSRSQLGSSWSFAQANNSNGTPSRVLSSGLGHDGGENGNGNGDGNGDDADIPDTLRISFGGEESSLMNAASQALPPNHVASGSCISGRAKSSVLPLSQQSPLTSRAGSARHPLDGHADDGQSNRNPGSSSSQPLEVDGAIESFLVQVTQSTSGCSIEQLEQVNREMMDGIWRTRHEWNRMKVLDCVMGVFNDTIRDIEDMQRTDPASQVKDAGL